MAKEGKEKRLLTEEHIQQRGALLDDMHERLRDLKRGKKGVPEAWTRRLAILAETDDADEFEKVADWCQQELPPKEYMTDEVTWETFKHFSSALADKITMRGMRCQLLADEDGKARAAELLAQVLAIAPEAHSPAAAMTELAKIRAAAIKQFKDIETKP